MTEKLGVRLGARAQYRDDHPAEVRERLPGDAAALRPGSRRKRGHQLGLRQPTVPATRNPGAGAPVLALPVVRDTMSSTHAATRHETMVIDAICGTSRTVSEYGTWPTCTRISVCLWRSTVDFFVPPFSSPHTSVS